jgi:probable rRNA maturation factor
LEITVQNRQRGIRVSTAGLRQFLVRLCQSAPASADSLALRLVSDRRMRDLNRRFRSLDRSTDVLSFATDDEPPAPAERHLGDIVISVPTARRQARRQRHSLARELKLLALHGYLHLLGYDHETDDGTMARLQRRLTRRLLATKRGREH